MLQDVPGAGGFTADTMVWQHCCAEKAGSRPLCTSQGGKAPAWTTCSRRMPGALGIVFYHAAARGRQWPTKTPHNSVTRRIMDSEDPVGRRGF